MHNNGLDTLYQSFAKGLDEETIPVFGEGDSDATVMLVGEAPGAKETEQGRPFVGQAGQNLNEFLEIINMDRAQLYVTNVVKYRPYKVNPKTGRKSNRPPKAGEVKHCAEVLLQEIELVNPKVIVTLGNTALRSILGERTAVIGDFHGKPHPIGSRDLFALYHPASIIYNRSLADVYLEDVHRLACYIKSL